MHLFQLMELIHTNEDALQFLKDRELLRSVPMVCPYCRNEMVENQSRTRGDGVAWECNRRQEDGSRCCKRASIRQGSFLAKAKLKLKTFVLLVYLWANGVSSTEQACLCDVSPKSVVQWNQSLRDVCSRHLVENPIRLGGLKKVVQIKTFLEAKRKSNSDHIVREKWVFGMYDVESKIGALVLVPDRTQQILFPIIEKYILPGSIIHSDKDDSYVNPHTGLSQLSDIAVQPPYQHAWINRQHNFVDPKTGVHTNAVRCMWKNAITKIKAMNGTTVEMLPSYLDEFQWRQLYGKKSEVFDNILQQISIYYPVNN